MVGLVGLNHHFAGLLAPARPARHLHQQLVGAFRRAVIGEIQRQIGHHSPDQRHLGKVQPLGDHLGTQQDFCLPGPEPVHQLKVGVLFRCGVNIHANHPGTGKEAVQFFFHLLGADAHGLDVGASAGGARLGHGPDLAAVMAAKGLIEAVVGHGHVAPGTLDGLPALAAVHRAGVTPPVDEQHGLMAARDAILQFLLQ